MHDHDHDTMFTCLSALFSQTSSPPTDQPFIPLAMLAFHDDESMQTDVERPLLGQSDSVDRRWVGSATSSAEELKSPAPQAALPRTLQWDPLAASPDTHHHSLTTTSPTAPTDGSSSNSCSGNYLSQSAAQPEASAASQTQCNLTPRLASQGHPPEPEIHTASHLHRAPTHPCNDVSTTAPAVGVDSASVASSSATIAGGSSSSNHAPQVEHASHSPVDHASHQNAPRSQCHRAVGVNFFDATIGTPTAPPSVAHAMKRTMSTKLDLAAATYMIDRFSGDNELPVEDAAHSAHEKNEPMQSPSRSPTRVTPSKPSNSHSKFYAHRKQFGELPPCVQPPTCWQVTTDTPPAQPLLAPVPPWPEVPPLPGEPATAQGEELRPRCHSAKLPTASHPQAAHSTPTTPLRGSVATASPSSPAAASSPAVSCSPASAESAAPRSEVVVDLDKPLHKCKTEELRAIARMKMLPHIERMERENLMENIRMVGRWEAEKTIADLQKVAQLIGCPVRPGGLRESLIMDMINHTWGDPEDKPQAAAAAEEPTSPPRPMPPPAPASASAAWPQQSAYPVEVGRSSSSTARSPSEQRRDGALAEEVQRIQIVKPGDFHIVLGFTIGEPMTLQLVTSRYRQLMRLLHPDKRTDAGIARAGGLAACEKALERVMEANRLAQTVLKRSSTLATGSARDDRRQPASWAWTLGPTARAAHHPPPPAWQPPSAYPPFSAPTTPAAARPKSPPGSKSARPFGWGPHDPLPPPHPNFDALRIVVVD